MSKTQITALFFVLYAFNLALGQLDKRMKPFLGTWEYEKIRGFEVWKSAGNELVGQGFRIKNETDTVLIEDMRVIIEQKKLVLFVRVANQNDGKEIRFDESRKTKYKFVNESHDFPKSIYYKFKRCKRNKVKVLFNHPHKDTFTKPIIMVKKR